LFGESPTALEMKIDVDKVGLEIDVGVWFE
jgi:hypothetical protein